MNKPNLRDGNHEIVIVKEKNERILTPEQTKEYDAKHPNARKTPMNLGAESHDLPKMNYDLGGMLSSIKSSTQNTPENIANANRIQKAADAIPEQSTSAPDLSQRDQQPLQWAFDKGGTVPAQESYTGRIMNRAKELYNQYKGDLSKYVSTVQEPMGGIAANQQNVDQYKAAEQAERPKMQQPYTPSPSDRINPGAKYGDRPGEKPPDKMQLFDDSGVVQPEKNDQEKAADDAAAKEAAMRQAETEVNAEERGRTPDQVTVDIGGAKAFNNPKGIKPQLDTDAPEFKPDYKLQGARMRTDNAPLKPAPMDTSNAAIEGPQPAPASTGVINAPRPSKMNYTPAAPEAKPEEVAAPDPMDIIRQDKMEAMKKGDNVALGNALIHENIMSRGKEETEAGMPQYTGKERIGKGTPGEAEAHKQFEDKRQDYDQRIQAAMDQGTPDGDREAESLQLAKSHFESMNPFGSPANRPGILGKLGHIASRVGEKALDAYIGPEATGALIPGSPEGRKVREADLRAEEAGSTKEELEQAQARAAGAKEPVSDKYDIKSVKDNDPKSPTYGQTVLAGVNRTDPTDVVPTGQVAPPAVEKPETREQHLTDYAALRARVAQGEKLSPEDQANLNKLQTEVSVGNDNAKSYNDRIKDLGVPENILSHYQVLPTDTDAQAKQKEAAAQSLEAREAAKEAKSTAKGEKDVEQAGKVFDKYSSALDKLSAPITASSQRSDLLVRNLDLKSKQGDALVAPELLSIAAGGAGSGLRMNEAEIKRVIGGRSVWGALKASANKVVEGNGTFDDTQREQLRMIASYVNERNGAQLSLLNKGRDALLRNQDNEAGIRGTYEHAQQVLSDLTSKGIAPAGSKVKSGDYVYHNGEVLKVTVGKDGKPKGTPIEF